MAELQENTPSIDDLRAEHRTARRLVKHINAYTDGALADHNDAIRHEVLTQLYQHIGGQMVGLRDLGVTVADLTRAFHGFGRSFLGPAPYQLCWRRKPIS